MESEEVIVERLNNLIVSVAKEEERSLDWRNRFCAKLDMIFKALDELPCAARIEQTKGIKKDIDWLQKITYSALILIIPALVGLGIAWGTMSTTVSHHAEVIKQQTKEETWKSYKE